MPKAVLDIENYLAHQILACYHEGTDITPFWEQALNPFIKDTDQSMLNLRSYHMLDFNDFAEFATSDLNSQYDFSDFKNNHIYFYQALPGTFDEGIFESGFGYDFSIVGAAIARKDSEYSVIVQVRYLTKGNTERNNSEGNENSLSYSVPVTDEGFKLYLDVLEDKKHQRYFNKNHCFPYEFFSIAFTKLKNSNKLAEKIRCLTPPPLLVGKAASYGLHFKISDNSLIEYYKEIYGKDNQFLKKDYLSDIFSARIDDHKCEFEFARLLLSLPSYYDFMYDLVVEERKKVGIRKLTKKKKGDIQKKGKPIYKIIKSVRVTYKAEDETRKQLKENKRSWTAPAYRFAVRGHWRRLQYAWSKGHDPQGFEILGKTWISEYEKGKEKEEPVFEGVSKDPEVTIKLKQTLSYARDVIKSHKVDKKLKKKPINNLIKSGETDKENNKIVNSIPRNDKPTDEWIYEERIKLTAGLRYLILKRDNFRCVSCGRSAEDGIKLEVDHKIPVVNWGRTVESNLRTLCRPCNQGKGATL